MQIQCETLPGFTQKPNLQKYAEHSCRLTDSHAVSCFLTNASSRELTLLQPPRSHPIKGCQIDFDNNFQLRLCIN